MNELKTSSAWFLTGWIWICGAVELFGGFYLIWLGINSSAEGRFFFFPFFTLATIFLLTSAGCFFRQRWAPWTATGAFLLLLLLVLIPAVMTLI